MRLAGCSCPAESSALPQRLRLSEVIPDPDTVKNSFELRLEVSAQAPVDRNDSRCVERSVETVFGYSALVFEAAWHPQMIR